ncbi:MAG: cation:proton antiporter [Bacteroidales bacterium]|nr:cation:proton antiporter [Bacteroidales bacterium]
MEEGMSLVRDLAVILISAGVFTIISKALKQPLILGYIVAGILVGPHIDFFASISSKEAVEQWSDIGVIFMMFGLGLEFSFKKLLKVGSGPIVTALVKAVGVFILGYVTGQALGWTTMESIFLGGLLSMSSTAVVLKSYDDLGLKQKPYASLVFGTLVVEDLIAILLMVLLSTMAVSNNFQGGELLMGLGKLLFFLILWFLIGIYVIPTVFKKAKKWLTDEILLLVSIGLCFGMVTLATGAGYSEALGAFLMGSILAETIESEHISKLISPIKDLFSAIFFVSVGMMVDPAVIAQNWAIILLLTVLVILTHILFSGAGIILTGNGLSNAVHTGFSLAQLGEFGFIIAGVGASLGVMSDFIYPVIIAVSVITTFTTPYMIKLAGPVDRLLQRKLPAKALERLQPVQKNERSAAEQSYWKKLLKSYFLRIALYGVIVIALSIASKVFLEPFTQRLFPKWSDMGQDAFIVAVTLGVMLPFIYGMSISSGDIGKYAQKLLEEKPGNRWPLFGLTLTRAFLGIAIVLGIVSTYFEMSWWAILVVLGSGGILFLLGRRYLHKFNGIENRFFRNLNQKEDAERRRKPVTTSVQRSLAGYDVHLELVELSPDSDFAGCRMKDIPFRSETGANIIKIERGSRSILIPDGNTVIYPFDRLLAVGTTAQIEALRKMMSASIEASAQSETPFKVVQVSLKEDSYLTGTVLKDTNMRDYHCMVISVLRGEEFITNPRPDLKFQSGDVVWIAGETASCEWLKG